MQFKKNIVAFLKLIRGGNLLIIITTLLVIKVLIISPFFNKWQVVSLLDNLNFSLLIISTVLISAAGYIINDYFDVKTDRINRPQTVVIDTVIKRRYAIMLHIVFTTLGILIGLYVAIVCHNLKLIAFQLIASVLLWFYSTHFKRQLLIGNIVVSILTAAVPCMPLMYDLHTITHELPSHEALKLTASVILFAVFAFLTSLAREIIKDMEDYKGDIATGCKTMPIAWGIIASKVFTNFTILITIGLLFFVMYKLHMWHSIMALSYMAILVILPLVYLLVLILNAKEPHQFKKASMLVKLIMLFGISFAFIIY